VRGATIEHGRTAILRTLSGFGLIWMAYSYEAALDLGQIASCRLVAKAFFQSVGDHGSLLDPR
jgi:hypothetical protein